MKQNKIEIRALEIRALEIRALEEDLMIYGLVNNYKESKMMFHIEHGDFQETIPKETWDDAINNNKENIKLHMNHLDGVSIAETLDIWTDENGVYFKAKLIPQARTLYLKIKEGIDIQGISIGFKCLQDKWRKFPSYSEREILKMQLDEISILDQLPPAYNNTEVSVSEGGVAGGRNDSNDYTNINNSDTTFNEIEFLQNEVDLLKYSIKNELDYIK